MRRQSYRWLDADAPEAPAHELLYRMASARQLLEIAADGERRARRYFRTVARASPAPEVRTLACEMANEEDEHLHAVTHALGDRGPAPDWEELLASGIGPGTVTSG